MGKARAFKISACYIVKNEAKNLAKSIKSLKSQVNEIVVVDTGSTDNTITVARKYIASPGRMILARLAILL